MKGGLINLVVMKICEAETGNERDKEPVFVATGATKATKR